MDLNSTWGFTCYWVAVNLYGFTSMRRDWPDWRLGPINNRQPKTSTKTTFTSQITHLTSQIQSMYLISLIRRWMLVINAHLSQCMKDWQKMESTSKNLNYKLKTPLLKLSSVACLPFDISINTVSQRSIKATCASIFSALMSWFLMTSNLSSLKSIILLLSKHQLHSITWLKKISSKTHSNSWESHPNIRNYSSKNQRNSPKRE